VQPFGQSTTLPSFTHLPDGQVHSCLAFLLVDTLSFLPLANTVAQANTIAKAHKLIFFIFDES
jgi:hypothetical protein